MSDKVTDKETETVEQNQPVETVTLEIDGQKVTVPKGTVVIRAAEKLGIDVPRFCDHPGLEPIAACRQCMVDVPDAGNGRGFPKPQASCSLQAAEGMVVKTQYTSDMAREAQQGIMEFLLVNHPLDCPICDKGGECPLQNQAMSAGQGATRFDLEKREFPKPINLVSGVLLDRERCIMCTRCVRFQEQIAGDPCIAKAERGAEEQIFADPASSAGSYFMGNTVQICPVGALTSSDYRFQARPFDLVSTDTTCEHCSVGCALRVDHRHGTITRRLAGEDMDVNQEWSCDKGRYGYRYGLKEFRLTTPLVRRDGQLVEASWTEALQAAAAGLAAAGSTAVIAPNATTVENQAAYKAFAQTALKTPSVDFRTDFATDEETSFLASSVAGHEGITFADLDAANKVVLVSFDPEDEAGVFFLRLRNAHRKHGTEIVAVASHLSIGNAKLGAQLVTATPGKEKAALRSIEGIDSSTVLLIGQRAASTPGLLTAAAEVADTTGACLAWVPAHAGDRGAVEAGILPAEGGKNTAAIIAAAANGGVDGLVLGECDHRDYADPQALVAAADSAFTVQLAHRRTLLTEHADVVFPVALVSQVNGHFVNWEARWRGVRSLAGVKVSAMSDRKVLTALGRAMGVDLGLPKNADLVAEIRRQSPAIAEPPRAGANVSGYGEDSSDSLREGEFVLDTWPELMGESEALAETNFVRSDHRRGKARISPATAEKLGIATAPHPCCGGNHGESCGDHGANAVRITLGERSVELRVAVWPTLADDVVWVPSNAPATAGLPLLPHGVAGPRVRLEATRLTCGSHAEENPGAPATERTAQQQEKESTER